MKIRILVFAAVMVCAFARLNAANYYMSPGGSDSDTGAAPTHAWASLQHGRDILVAGDTLFVMGGTYATAQVWNGGNGGSTLHPIVIKAYGDHVATFTAGYPIETNQNYFFLFYDSPPSVHHIVIDGESHLHPGTTRYLVFTGACYRMYMTQCTPTSYRHGMVLRGCEFDGTLSNSTKMGANPVQMSNCDSFVVDNCYIHHAWHATGSPGGSGETCEGCAEQTTGDCMTICSCSYGRITNNTFHFGNHSLCTIGPRWMDETNAPTCKYLIISGNTFDNGWGLGLGCGGSPEHFLIENNYFANCGNSCQETKSKPALQIGGSYFTIRKNVIYNPWSQGLRMEAQNSADGNNTCNNDYIYNNTIFNCEEEDLGILVSNSSNAGCSTCSAENNWIVNNILYKTTRCSGPPTCWISDAPYSIIPIILGGTNAAHDWTTNDSYGGWAIQYRDWGHNHFLNNIIRQDARGIVRDSIVVSNPSAIVSGQNWNHRLYALQQETNGAWRNNIGGDPKLVSESPDTYGVGWWYLQPNSNSACIDSGVAVVDSNGIWMRRNVPGYSWNDLTYSGSAPDIGAYEVNGENPTPPMAPVLSSSPTRKR